MIVLLSQMVSCLSFADDATVLPKGRWRFLLDSLFYFPITQRYNGDGHTEDVATDFNKELNSSVFPDLSLVEAGFGLPPGSASFGTSVVSFEWNIQELTFQPSYGLTDRLSVGLNIPYWWEKNNVNASLNASNATVGINPGVPGGVAPIGFPGTSPPTTNDIQNLLVSQGFKKVETWSGTGIGDIEAGGRYQYYNSDTWRLAFTGGVRFPTGQVDDPDNLVDRGLGTGAYALLFRFNQDFIGGTSGPAKQLGVPDAGSYSINTTFRYDYYLADKQELRVCNIHTPVCPDKENVHRNLGNVVEGEISASIGLLQGLYLSPLYLVGHGFKNFYSGDKGFDYGTLAEQTDYTEQVYIISLTYSTLPLVVEKKFPLPVVGTISYRDRFAGNNNLYKSRYLGFTLETFF
jgi:hypothetical protein